MAEGAPQVFSMRVFLALIALSLLVMVTMVSARPANAQTPEGTLHIIPDISRVAAESGPFTVYLVLENLEHYGVLSYDDDRDTVPDREVESVGLAAFEFTIEYDEAVLTVAEVEQGPAFERSSRAFQCLPPLREPGSFRFGCLSTGAEPPGLQGTLTLASVTLRPLGPGSSPLLLEVGLAGPLGDDVPVAVSGGIVRVTGRPVATATRALSTGDADTPSPQPDVRPVNTPSPAVGTTEALITPAASENGQTPEAATTPAAEEGGNPPELTVRERDLEAENGRSAAAGGRSSSSVALWTAVAVGSLAAAGALGLGAILWQRRRHRGGA